jgi:hypothetical protein
MTLFRLVFLLSMKQQVRCDPRCDVCAAEKSGEVTLSKAVSFPRLATEVGMHRLLASYIFCDIRQIIGSIAQAQKSAGFGTH